jgi:splicing factor 3A subunit 2
MFACEPYETIAFKIPNHEIDKSEGRFFTNWDQSGRTFTLQLYFRDESSGASDGHNPGEGGRPRSARTYHGRA